MSGCASRGRYLPVQGAKCLRLSRESEENHQDPLQSAPTGDYGNRSAQARR
jgi:hypothetical protein